MDKKAIKNFAIESRQILRDGVITKLTKLGINEKEVEEAIIIETDLIEIPSSKERYSGKDVVNRNKLITELERKEKQLDQSQKNTFQLAFEVLVEEVAYTWFNRLIAIRFLEVNDYLPERIRILSSETSGKREPDIITNLLDSDLFKEMDSETQEKVVELLSDNSAGAVDELYQLVFIKQCNSLNKELPNLFEKIDDYTELLFSISYIDDNGVIANLLTIPESDFDVREEGQVEIIGWMYQYYNTEPKDKVFARGNRKIRADEIPAATQLFTPDWIVRYMVENSLGRYYIDQKLADPSEERTEKEIADSFGWQYYLPSAEQPEEVQLQILEERKKKNVFDLQELKLIDPSMGSGHILVYAFDVLIQLYSAEGYRDRDAAELILSNNLFGLDIDKRAFQLTYFALMMKGRQYSRRILTKNIMPKVYSVPNNFGINETELQLLHIDFPNNAKGYEDLLTLSDGFKHGDDLGSLIKFNGIDFENLKTGLNKGSISLIEYGLNEMIDVGELLQQEYEIGITNPPYMGSSGFNQTLSKFSKKNYPNSKSDLFAMFMERWNLSIKTKGYSAMVTMQSWMFLSSYESMRKNIIQNYTISNLMHMENMVMGIAFGTVVTILNKDILNDFKGTYHQIKTQDVSNENVPQKLPISGNRFNQTNQKQFNKIPGSPISYWVSENLIHNFEVGNRMETIIEPKQGMATSDNMRFLRMWYEIDTNNFFLYADSLENARISKKKWFPYNKGGAYRKWYGNFDYVVNWFNDGKELEEFHAKLNKTNSGGRIKNKNYYFKESLTWPLITSGGFSARYRPYGSIFDVAGMSAFGEYDDLIFILGILNSPIGNYIFKILNPTINLQAVDFRNFPIITTDKESNKSISSYVTSSIELAKLDWDSVETSWEFRKHPIV
ncbi:BREX-1 system adenine-specific DNA-methyltransferase PglX [Vagococcus fluvialis]|uniref:BREX-1 system adenine-specific DNA-methyltransferase PglX n=1 Tax=Vagococcus fluvialis TaxID=2738 RepID=UPI003B59C94B